MSATASYGPWTDRFVGPCPVHPRQRVQVQRRGGTREQAEGRQDPRGAAAVSFIWAIENRDSDIIALREVLR